MTAPQHDANPIADQANTTQATATHQTVAKAADKAAAKQGSSPFVQRQKIQRCWFITLGLLGGFGFVASQVSLASAQTDFLITDYSADSGSSGSVTSSVASSYAVADAAVMLDQAAFEVTPTSQAAAVPEAFIEAPASPSAAVAALTSAPQPVTPAPIATFQPAAPVAPPVSSVASPQPATPTSEARIDIEITPAAVPTVTPVQSPRFTSDFTAPPKPVAAKTSSRSHPLVGLIEASAVAAPISAYAAESSQGLSRGSLDRAELIANEAGVAPATEAVPDILPAPVEVAPPVVEAASPIVEAVPSPQEAPIQATEIVPAALPEGTNLPEEYNNIFVDPTDYSVGATEATPPTVQSPEVVISEQSTGCEFTVGQGQAVPNGACATGLPPAPAPVAEAGYPQNAPVANAPAASLPVPQATAPTASAAAVNVGPVTFSASGIRLSTSAAGREYINRAVRPLVNLQAAQDFIFPLSIPSPITSLFGYRIHP
ncbi:MAG: hypothetical protein AAFY72_04235, partial [Cyanobacteria bacterium J06649_4]